jgi:hypothetical protein
MNKDLILTVREQIQEDLLCALDSPDISREELDTVCQIVVDNFKKLLDTVTETE